MSYMRYDGTPHALSQLTRVIKYYIQTVLKYLGSRVVRVESVLTSSTLVADTILERTVTLYGRFIIYINKAVAWQRVGRW